MMEKSYRIAVLGAKKTGKTCLINRLLKKRFPEKYDPTIETLFRYDIRTCEDKFTKLEILDAAGDFEFPDMLRKAIRSCHAFVLVFDVSNPQRTFGEVETLRQLIHEEKCTESLPIIVIGNKSDLVSKQDNVDNKILDAIVSIDWGCPYITTSAKCDVNISDVYTAVCKELKIKIKHSSDVNGNTTKHGVKHRRLSFSAFIRRMSVLSL